MNAGTPDPKIATCPSCGAAPGKPCWNGFSDRGRETTETPHKTRIGAAARVARGECYSVRKPYKEHAGYRASARTGVAKGWVVIYEADEQGFDVGGARYAVVCETHKTIVGATSMRDARDSMKAPENFCDGCRGDEARP